MSELIARRLAPGELSAAMQHLAECSACREQINGAYNTEERLAALRAQFITKPGETERHPSYEQLSGFVDRSLPADQRTVVQSHLEACDDCAEEARGFRTLLAALQTHSVKSAIQPARTEKAARVRKPVFVRLGFAAAAIAVIALIIIAGWRRPATIVQHNEIATEGSTPSPSPATSLPTSETKLSLTDQGHRITLDSQGNLTELPSLPAGYERIVKAALTRQRAPVSPAIAELASDKGTLLGPGDNADAFDLLTPVAKVVSSNRPAFRWRKVAAAESYSVVVLDQHLNVMAQGETDGKTSWTPPEPLPRDQVLRWQVTAKIGDKQIISPIPPMPEARFKILPQAKAAELSQAAKEYANSHLLLGTLYAEAGLVEEAEREFRSLLAENPGSKIAQKLLRSVQIRKPGH
ncbi:MAG: zf-HC2 domain-containing protein [Acidobacteriota bacterium]